MIDARQLYEDVYCKRGEMENRIKETQSDLFGDRMPATTMRANQLRMWFSAIAYVLMCALRRIALAGTEMERATCATIRLRLLKIGAQVTVSVRRVKAALATCCPYQELFTTAYARLSSAARKPAPRPPTDQPQRNIGAPAQSADSGNGRVLPV